MRTGTFLAAGIGLAALATVASGQERQLGAHEHGRGTLNIALDGSKLTMELEAPGADIVGFEHAASTPEQKAAIDKAEKLLAVPRGLFELPAAAGCVFQEAKVEIEGEDHDDADKDHDHAGHDHDAKAEHAGHEHSAFRAEYSFDCKTPSSLTAIGFDYFKAFAGAQKLDVTVATPKGQSQFEVTRAKPRLDLGGMM